MNRTDFAQKVADALGWKLSYVYARVRLLVLAGLLHKGKRGRQALDLSAREAAMILLGCVSHKIPRAPAVASRLLLLQADGGSDFFGAIAFLLSNAPTLPGNLTEVRMECSGKWAELHYHNDTPVVFGQKDDGMLVYKELRVPVSLLIELGRSVARSNGEEWYRRRWAEAFKAVKPTEAANAKA